MIKLKGLDISKHNGKINWKTVSQQIDFVMLRGGYSLTVDKCFHENAKGCKKNNIPFGVYWFSYALTPEDAKAEALKCLETIKPYDVEYPVAFDLENDTNRYFKQKTGSGLTKEIASDMVRSFCSTIENAGYYAMNYSNRDYLTRMFDDDVKTKYDLWYALWGADKDRSCGMWQYSSTERIEGIETIVDHNIAYKDYKILIKNLGLNKRIVETEVIDYETLYKNLVNEVLEIREKIQYLESINLI